ncbi:hypothetical protein [Qipengyuania flava]|uniref:hypothetical protein n=1 Tax=Qipengyuania flava TaxID=192812 RepID=UPI001C6265F4|nr:hypothetical protein [Qipengyuania flava]QYJ07833.1 hypothetical protein KUV82_03730 [Qipengyuania flava]
MIKRLAFCALAVSLAHAPLGASEDPYQKLLDAMASEEFMMEGTEDTMRTMMVSEFERDADMVAFEEECPGVYSSMTDAMMPTLLRSHRRAVGEYRTDLLALFRDRLSVEDAAGAAEFYASENGQALVRLAGDSVQYGNAMDEIRDSEDMVVSEESFAADKEATRKEIKANLEPVLAREVGLKLLGEPWFARFLALRPEMDALELKLMNDDFTPEEDAEVDAALDRALTAKMDECYPAE